MIRAVSVWIGSKAHPVFMARTDTGAFYLRVSGRIRIIEDYLGYWHQRADERDGNPLPR